MNPFQLDNKTILVTGASSGIGRATAIDISRQGGTVILVGRNKSRLEDTYNQLQGKGHMIEDYDLNNIDDISDWLLKLTGIIGMSINGFVHCAGISTIKPISMLNKSDLEKIMTINVYAGIALLKAAARPKVSPKGSSFVFISSVAGVMGEAGALAYSMSKGSLITTVKSAALELARYRYRVNSIAPGMVATPMLQQYRDTLGEEQVNNIVDKFPLGLGDPHDVANGAIYLLSDASKWVTGTTLIIDGGYTAGK